MHICSYLHACIRVKVLSQSPDLSIYWHETCQISQGLGILYMHNIYLHVNYIFFMNTTTALDLWSITNELGSVIDKWFEIGVQLRLSEAKLRQIEADHHTVNRYFSEVISFWFNGNTQVAVSWKSLVEVLESPFVDEKGLAKKLREKGGLELPDENVAPSTTGI